MPGASMKRKKVSHSEVLWRIYKLLVAAIRLTTNSGSKWNKYIFYHSSEGLEFTWVSLGKNQCVAGLYSLQGVYSILQPFSQYLSSIYLSLSPVCVCVRARACMHMHVYVSWEGGEGEFCVSLYVTFGMAFRAHSDNPGGLSRLRIKTLPQGHSSHLQRPFSSFHIKKCYSSWE